MLKEMESKLEQYLMELADYKIHYKSNVERIEAETGKTMRDQNKHKLKNELEEQDKKAKEKLTKPKKEKRFAFFKF